MVLRLWALFIDLEMPIRKHNQQRLFYCSADEAPAMPNTSSSIWIPVEAFQNRSIVNHCPKHYGLGSNRKSRQARRGDSRFNCRKQLTTLYRTHIKPKRHIPVESGQREDKDFSSPKIFLSISTTVGILERKEAKDQISSWPLSKTTFFINPNRESEPLKECRGHFPSRPWSFIDIAEILRPNPRAK